MPKPMKTPITVAIENVEERKSFRGISASSFMRTSAITKPITPRMPTT